MLFLYVLVAVLNYSPVQSIIGSVVSDKLSKKSGGTVRVGSIGLNVLNHVKLRDIELITPQGDTVCKGDRIVVRFEKFPYLGDGISFSRVYVRDVYYCFANAGYEGKEFNLSYLINCFAPSEPRKRVGEPKHFYVYVGDLILRNVHYRMDIKESPTAPHWDEGVDIPHMEFSEVSGKMRNIRVDADHVTCRIERLACREKSGFRVDNICGNVYVSNHGICCSDFEVKNDKTHLLCDVILDYPRWETMLHYVDSVYMSVRFKPGTVGCMRDAAYWAPVLWGMDEEVKLDGFVYGPVANLHARGMNIAFGLESRMAFDGYIYGLPNIDTTIISGDIHGLHTTYADLASVKHPEGYQMRAEEIVKKLDVLDIDASFLGTIKDFRATANVATPQGTLDADLALKLDPEKNIFDYDAEVNSSSMQLAVLMPNDWVSRSGFTLAAHGTGFDPKKMEAKVEGQLFNTHFRGANIAPADLTLTASNGQMDLDFRCADRLMDVAVAGNVDMRDSVYRYSAQVGVNHLDMGKLRLVDVDSVGTLQARLDLHGEGNDIETLKGTLEIDNARLNIDDRWLALRRTRLSADNEHRYKNIDLNCDLFDLTMKGYFDYADFGAIVTKFKQDFVPVYFAQPLPKADFDPQTIADCQFEFGLRWNDSTDQIAHFIPGLSIANGSALQGNYNYTESLKLAGRSTSIKFGTFDISEVILTTAQRGNHYGCMLSADQVRVADNPILEKPRISARLTPDLANLGIYWDDQAEEPNKGRLAFAMNSTADTNIITITRNEFTIHGEPWRLSASGPVVLARDGITARRVRAASAGQSVVASFDRHHDEEDELLMEFETFDLESVSFLLQPTGFSVAGIMDGNFTMQGFDDQPHLEANLTIGNCNVNDQPLGDAQVNVGWNSDNSRLYLDLQTSLRREDGPVTPLSAEGYINLGETTDTNQMRFDVTFEEFALQTIAPLVRDFSSRFEGCLHGDLSVSGTPQAPVISGVAAIDRGVIKVDFLNTVYTFNDTLRFDNENITLRNFIVHDEKGGMAFLNGGIHHHNFKDFRLDVGINTDRFLFLNTTARDNSAYYGTVMAYANGRVSGPLDNIDVRVRARTMPGSSLYVPITDQLQVQEVDFIEFVSDEVTAEEVLNKNVDGARSDNKFNLTIDIDVTPDVKLYLPMDFSSMYVDIGAVGTGDLQMSVSDEVPFSLIGDYEISDGNMSLNLLGLITKNFTIDEGSSIKFTGDIPNAIFDIAAVYSQRVNISTLTGSVSTNEHVQSNVPVENVIALNGTLTSPTLNFDIRLPNADQSLQDEVFAFIDRTNERDMLNQTVSLLIMGQFYNNGAATAATGNLIDNGISSGYSVVANSLGSVVSNMVDFVDINFGYKAATDLTTEHYEVDINKEWNKFYLETSFGYGGDSREMSSVQGDNNLTGDMLLGYKLNQRLHLFVFNRSNTNDYTRSDLPYKQGVGLKYTREFDNVRELLPRSRAKNRNRKK